MRRIRVVVHRVRIRVIVINRPRLIDDDLFWLVIGHINHIILGWRDVDRTFLLRHQLVVVALEIACGIGAVPKLLDCRNNVGLLSHDGLTKTPGPVKIVCHHLDDFRIVAQRDD